MKEIILTLGGSTLTALVVLVALSAFDKQPAPSGGLIEGQEYTATTTGPSSGNAAYRVLRTRGGAVGNVVITGSAAGDLFLYDATSTQSVNLGGQSTTTLVHIPKSASTGTYSFDVSARRGIVLEIIGTQPTSTIGYR